MNSMFLRNLKRLRFGTGALAGAAAVLLVGAGASGLGAQTRLELGGDGAAVWRMSLHDSPANALPELDATRWKVVEMPVNLARLGAKPGEGVWLRTEFDITIERTRNLALRLGPVYDHDRVYLNGVRIGASASEGASGYGRPRLYTLPAGLLRPGGNTLALRLEGQFPALIGLRGVPTIEPVQAAAWSLWSVQARQLAFAGIYFAVGFFFLILYLKVPELREYRWFGLLAMIFALHQFLVNEWRFEIADVFLVWKVLEQLTYIALPPLYFYFHVNFFDAEALRIKTSRFRLDLNLRRLGRIYSLAHLGAGVAILVLFHPVWWDRIITVWFLFNAPFFLYFAGDAFRRALGEFERDAIVLSIGVGLMLLITAHFYAVERGWLEGPAYFEEGILLFVLFVAFALTYRLIELQTEVDERQERLETVNVMRDRVFSYLNSFIHEPTREITDKARQILQAGGPTREAKLAASSLEKDLEQLQASLDDILELARLEVISEPEYVETINFRDFISAVIPQGVITHYIKVDPDIELHSSLELVNSLVIRLIDFPAFRQFRHIDLIITSDLDGFVHFRFMLFHTNTRVTRRLYDMLTDQEAERGEVWVKWSIIREIIRILDGAMNINIINRKFLSIDIELAGELPRDEALRAARQEGVTLQSAAPAPEAAMTMESGGDLPETAARPTARSRPERRAARELPKLHAKMTVGEFAEYLKARFARR